MSQLWSITAVKPLRGRERVHSASSYLLMADTQDQARDIFEREENDDGTRFCFISTPKAVSGVQLRSCHTCTPAQLAKMRGEEPPAPKPQVEPKPSTRPLGETQLEVLRGLKEHGGWRNKHDWVWDTPAHTERLLASLHQRCLADRTVEGGYIISALGLQALEAQPGR